jgi:hypothetical protein
MYLFKKTVFNCKQATLLSIKRDEGSITVIERLKLSYHLFFCDPCKKFIEQSRRIDRAGTTIDQMLGSVPPFSLSEETKKKLQHRIDEAVG